MKKSAQAAVSYANSRAESLGIDPDFHADLEELPPKIRRSMTFVPVESMDEVLATALVAKDLPAG